MSEAPKKMKSAKKPLLDDGFNTTSDTTAAPAFATPTVTGAVDRMAELRKKRAGVGQAANAAAAGDTQQAAAGVQFGASDDLNSDPAYIAMVADIKTMRRNVEEIQKQDDKGRQAADEQTIKQVMSQVDNLINDTSNRAGKVKKVLDDMKAANDAFERSNPNSARAQIRRNLYQTQLRRFHQVVGEYNTASARFKEGVKVRTRRQIKMVNSDMTDDDIDKVIASGTSAQQIIQQALVSDDLSGVVEDIEERHQGILKLEKQVLEVYELFKDLATLVDLQQESLDVISNNVMSSKNFVEKAETELVAAEAYQKKARKRQCCILVIILAVLVAVLWPVIQKQSEDS